MAISSQGLPLMLQSCCLSNPVNLSVRNDDHYVNLVRNSGADSQLGQ
jgi:hypothetical protein